MAEEWYYIQRGTRVGPISFGDLQALARSHVLSRVDMVRCGVSSDWRSACDVRDLFDAESHGDALHDNQADERSVHSTRAVGGEHTYPVAQLVLEEPPTTVQHTLHNNTGRTWLNAILMLALIVTLPLWLFGFGRWVAVTGVTWVMVGGRAAWTGIAPTGIGSGVYQPGRYRIFGTVLALLGVVLIVGALGPAPPR